MKLSFNNKKAKQRVISFVIAVAIITNLIPFGDLSEIITSSFSISASATDYTPNKTADDFPIGNYNFQHMSDFVDYCYYYNHTEGFAQNHQNDTLDLPFTQDDSGSRGIIPDTYEGLGTSEYPFNGTLRFSGATFTLQAHRALFRYVYDSVKLLNYVVTEIESPVVLNLVRLSDVGDDESKPLFADYVVHNTENKNSAEWKITLDSSSNNTYSGVIGEIRENAEVNLSFTNNSNAGVVSNSTTDNVDVGVICEVTKSGSTINLDYSGSAKTYSVTSAKGNAGGLVGTMENGSTLNINSFPNTVLPSVVSNNDYAGGLVGELSSDSKVNNQSGSKISVGGSVTGTIGAGGLFGHYTNYITNEFDISYYDISATVYGQYCGGVFGVLENQIKSGTNTSNELTIKNTGNQGTISITSGIATTYAYDGYFGGIIGKYTTDNLRNSLILDTLTITSVSQASFNAFGGAIGIVDLAAYIKADSVTVNATGTAKRTSLKKGTCENYAYFGGLIGATSTTDGVFVDVGDFILTTTENFCGGGIVGRFNNGVLRLSGTTDMKSAKPEGVYGTTNEISLRYSNYGQLVGYNDNVLVYALGDGSDESPSYNRGWQYKRSSEAISDDLGTWGEVVRVFNVEGTNKNAEQAGIVTLDSTEHTVTLEKAETSIGSTVDFAKTALNIMLNKTDVTDYDCLKFTSESGSTRDDLLSTTLMLTDNIDLSKTGINGFMRDGDFDITINTTNNVVTSNINSSNIGDVGTFTGTLNGSDKIVTLAIGESYGVYTEGQTEGTGQIYRHCYNGLFSVIGNGNDSTVTVNNLTVDGNVNIRNAGAYGMNVGGIAARSHGSTTLNHITVKQTVDYYEQRKFINSSNQDPTTVDTGNSIGGLIAYVDNNSNNSDNGTIAVKGNTEINPTFKFSGSHNNWMMYGGAIGNVVSSKVTINFAQDDSDKCTVSMKANTNGEANDFKVAKYASGGLIGHINTNGTYKDKKVNINNLDFNSCTVADPAQNTGGGFLGYSWHNTYVTIDGLTVTNGTLDCLNSAANVGVMCYRATGVWKVNSLAINGLTMSKGGDASLGMLVNKAYNKVLNANTKTYVTSGLYLNVLNSGYKLTDSGIKLPDSLETFDEIAAYSVDPTDPNSTNELTTKNVLIGNAGVISINMNTEKDGTETKITTTGTYQNQLTSVSSTANNNTKYANPYSRYYYNLDVMDSIYDSQNLLLWSVKKYAATNIQGEFVTTLTDDNLNGSADLTGLSFYPLANADSCTLKNLNIKFDYSVLYNNAETTNNNDGYTRDPGKSNQHYLMHSGLFLNVPTGKTVTISGDLSLSGTFLEIDGYSGVLVSQTVNGNIKSASGSKIKLDGIKPKTKDNAEYQDGYLLINNIERESDLTAAPNIYIEGVYTTNNYSADGTTSQVAKSLIGAATGKGLNIVFSKIKLDSRDGNSTDESLNAKAEELYNAYCTYNSIFTNSTLLASIKTDQNATLEYNYTYDEDWGTGNRHVTYGKEVTDSKEYVGEENRYYGDPRNFTNPVFSDNTEFYFSSGFLEYVDEVYTGNKDSNGLYYRELKVNVMTVALDEGCGTYNDPYVITGEKQLEAVAKFIGSGLTSDLSQLNLPKEQLDGITVNAKGDRWCNDKNGTEYHDVFKPSTSDSTKYVTADNANTWSATNVQYYLANAYYKIDSDIELSENFLGLGGNSENTAFRGVIVGNNNTITNKSDKPFINVSNGSVIKDLNIVVANEAITLNQTSYGSQEAYFYYDSKCKYYGGIIGEIMGGDNIIDNSYVSYQSTITLSGTYGMLCPVGSYVGVVVFGGLIFKNINATTANDNARSGNEDQENYPDNFVVNYVASNTIPTGDEKNLALSDSKGAIYVNPLVGRVINGYAVNETDRFSVTENNEYHYDDSTTDDRRRNGTLHSLKNNTKHYTIADINPNLDKLNVTKVPKGTDADGSKDGNINIPNAQAFFILSLITQSCSGTATTAGGEYVNSLSYGTNNTVYGMSHIADYNAVGTTETDSTKVADYNNLASKDTAAKTAVPYIIARYTKSVNKSDTDTTQVYPARCVTSTKGYYDIDLTENVDYVLPDSFRGIGSVGRMNDTANDANASESKKIEVLYYTFKLDTFDGKGCTIDIDMYINRYWKRIDNYFDYLHNGTIQKGNNSLLEFDNLAKYKVNGFGLFDTVVMRNEASAIKAFTLSGSVNVESYKYDTQKPNPTGEEDKARHDDTFTNVMWLSVGGVCGWSRNDHYVMFEKINLNDLSVRGPCKVAGLLGESGISSKYINVSVKECGADNLSLELTNGGAKGNNGREAYRNSIGAFVGKVAEGKVIVDGGNNGKTVTLNKFSILSTGGAGYSAGGLVAYAGNGCEVTNMTVSPVDSSKPITIGRDDAGTGMAGGIVGLMQPYTQDVKTNNCFAVFEGCKVENLNIKGNYAGGFYGGTWDDGWVPVNITINNCEVVGKLNSENKINNDIYGKTYAGGIVACGRVSKDGNPNIQISNTKVANYNITAKGSNYVGGMIGYCDSHQSNSSVVCYMYNSSIENCILGTGTNYSGGVMGKINKKVANKILGYNVKLDKVTSESSYMGAWVGYMASSDTTTSIQFTGMAIYGDGFSKNVGNDDANLNNTRFVFADYNGACNNADSGGNQKNISGFNYDDTGTHVTMPKYPYVNISPQSKMGTLTETTSEYISGDGAVLYSEPVTEYSEKTAEKTMAAKIYADTLLTDSTDKNYSRRYTTFSDTEIYDGKKIDYYLKRTVDEDSDRISTYATERGSVPEGVDDFAVVVIANKNDT
ncbi:MAG: hypothetical protein PUG48_07335, partial [Clostridia bacterium]|nr:hypothetical protein [Clostridia bacterium]